MKRIVKSKQLLLTLILVLTLLIGGCNFDTNNIWNPGNGDQDQLIKVEITFTDDQKLTGYVKNLGIEKDGVVYVGGSSLNYLYDSNGTIIGSFNYQRVLYMKIITEAKTD